ncbi:MAG TPA: tryptophan synthase subunit alpha [Spirochaetota bacterium]|nr:tryptophan synthase subunit alpha [Spirochaetota bacterium]HOM38209.1 tryptophan synthase subunit alpha [Spirochaetota bacterium]HPQ48573.1 tryptophan synthase subunit alpha [Spirochaetota bacterium]
MRGIYIVGGYPDKESFLKIADIVLNKMDFIEIGIPFSDPVADGPIISSAINNILGKINVKEIIDITKLLGKEKNIFYMTYSNIIYSYGIKKFSDEVKNYIKGIIIADLPNRLHDFFYQRGLEIPIIPFITPESRESDIKEIIKYRPPFIYFIGIRGITGSKADLDNSEIIDKIKVIKKLTDIPVIIGFGIKGKKDAKKAISIADGFVIGTEAVKVQNNLQLFIDFVNSLQ